MNKSIVAAIGLVAILSQQPLEAQRRSNTTSSTTRQTQRDVEFLSLYNEVSELEAKLANVEEETESGPASISEKIVGIMYDKITKLASRYRFALDRNESAIFTFGKSLVVANPGPEGQYVILNDFLAIDSRISGIDANSELLRVSLFAQLGAS